MNSIEDLTRRALGLPLEQRSALTERLLESLDELTPEELEQVWAAEAERRFAAFKAGKVEVFSGPDTHREILAEIK